MRPAPRPIQPRAAPATRTALVNEGFKVCRAEMIAGIQTCIAMLQNPRPDTDIGGEITRTLESNCVQLRPYAHFSARPPDGVPNCALQRLHNFFRQQSKISWLTNAPEDRVLSRRNIIQTQLRLLEVLAYQLTMGEEQTTHSRTFLELLNSMGDEVGNLGVAQVLSATGAVSEGTSISELWYNITRSYDDCSCSICTVTTSAAFIPNTLGERYVNPTANTTTNNAPRRPQ